MNYKVFKCLIEPQRYSGKSPLLVGYSLQLLEEIKILLYIYVLISKHILLINNFNK